VESKPGRIPLELEKPANSEPAPMTTSVAGSDSAPADLEEKIVAALRTCYDPEIPVNIYELGLIYDIIVLDGGEVEVRMTLTSPACPAAGSLPPEVQAKVKSIPGVSKAKVDVVWEPTWTQDRMSDAAKLQLGLF
jgi:FeS assembly SUF system protein